MVEVGRMSGWAWGGYMSLEGFEYWCTIVGIMFCTAGWSILVAEYGRGIILCCLREIVFDCKQIHGRRGVILDCLEGRCGWWCGVHSYIYFGGVLVSPGSATTSAGGVLTLVSSFFFCHIFIVSVPLFISLSFLLLVIVLLVLPGGSSSLMIIPGGVHFLCWWFIFRGGALPFFSFFICFPVSLFPCALYPLYIFVVAVVCLFCLHCVLLISPIGWWAWCLLVSFGIVWIQLATSGLSFRV